MYGWAKPVQDSLSARLLPVAQAAGAGVEVLVDVRHMTLRVAVADGTPTVVKKTVRDAVLATPEGANLKSHRWSIVVEPPHPRPYTSHFDWSQIARPHPQLRGEVCVMVLHREEVVAIRDALGLLRQRVASARVVGTFAMGGLALLHWLTSPASGAATAQAASLANSARYHVLPGLNWSGTPREKAAFKAWLSSEVTTPGEIFLFDTGREGNGIRQAATLAQEAVESCSPIPGVSIVVAGFVDGRPRAPERQTAYGVNGCGLSINVDYTRVPYLPTEDNGLLLGYEVDRSTDVLYPLSGLLLYRVEETPRPVSCLVRAVGDIDGRLSWIRNVVTTCGHHLTRHALVGTSSGAITLETLILGNNNRSVGKRAHKADREWATAGLVLAHAQSAELEAVENAIAAGLVTPPVLNGVVRRHEREQVQLLSRHWNRERKRVVTI